MLKYIITVLTGIALLMAVTDTSHVVTDWLGEAGQIIACNSTSGSGGGC